MRKLLLITGLLHAAMGCQNEKGEALPEGKVTSPDASQDRPTPGPVATDDQGPLPVLERIKIESYADLGKRSQTRIEDGVIITEGVIRVRRRHENDMDFSKYNPFYWEGRLAFFKVEDFTGRGEKKLRFHLETEWPQDFIPTRGPDFSAIYTGDPLGTVETVRSKFAINQRMEHVGDRRRFVVTLGPDVFQAYPEALKTGRLLTFEFRFFLDETHPDWKKEKDFNQHTLSAYYSEFYRLQVGQGGLLIDTLGAPDKEPDALRFSGGWTTIPTVRVEPWKALQQQATNITRDEAQNFLDGRTFFHTDMKTGQHVDDADDDKPLVFFEEMRASREAYAANAYNMTSCNGCHVNNGMAFLPAVGQAVHSTLAKTFEPGTGQPHPQFGQQLQTAGAAAEGTLRLKSFAETPVMLDDGTVVTLRKPIFSVESSKSTAKFGISIRKPPALIGMGLLNAVPETTLKNLARVSGGEWRGRFGWKGQQLSLRDQIVAALNLDMGVVTQKRSKLDCESSCIPGKGQLPEEALDKMEAYVSLLGVPPRIKPKDPTVQRGAEIFEGLECSRCHQPVLKTGSSPFKELAEQTIQPFTDLLLHDMGEGLADDSGGPDARKWRTAPLWGLKNVKHAADVRRQQFHPGDISILYTDTMKASDQNPIQLLHDGRAQSLAEAILWHGGQAETSVKRYKALPRADREALEAFLWDL
ncbi:MAG TPA: di-heme oxidoredictase family protein [Oligoflexus sp.]|uniref:di-heme oxidoredictase family protein n=1 Tax=Oligoflexus sp. TaxID=1971216 RepID=UPI002D7ECCCD|nr:di-heme oxidoredictase family protein [Oligoflexus sp.]HET9240362.1 di-heme oxidoredictase family protein [Oligoflexus sp.]